jgi:hypothetical protein
MNSNLRSLFSALLASTVLIAVPVSSAVSQSPAKQPSTAQQLSVSRMGLGGIKLGTKASEVERKLGKPPQMASETSMCCGTLLYWQYPEIEVRFEVPEGIRQERNARVYSIVTRSSKFATLEGIRVGDRRSKVLRTYGTPSRTEEDLMFYNNDAYAASLGIRFSGDRVIEISTASLLN